MVNFLFVVWLCFCLVGFVLLYLRFVFGFPVVLMYLPVCGWCLHVRILVGLFVGFCLGILGLIDFDILIALFVI